MRIPNVNAEKPNCNKCAKDVKDHNTLISDSEDNEDYTPLELDEIDMVASGIDEEHERE